MPLRDPWNREHTCHRTRVAESGMATVEACSCGTLHLNLGPLTLRLTREALTDLVGTLGYALAWVQHHEDHAEARERRHVC
ncbi:MAG: hypothetical protein KIT72_16520 [Polyangiaceae bacterium]|nr:hypothetical protein [Polyangiaceae bacterium]MCW5792022.1 hypothetical protein [Polyangiaceae bacterium]